MNQGNVPVMEFAALKSEVHHLGVAVTETRGQVDKLGGEFGRVAREVHHLSHTLRWIGAIFGTVITAGLVAAIWRIGQ